LLRRRFITTLGNGVAFLAGLGAGTLVAGQRATSFRGRTLIDADWLFTKGDPPNNTVSLLYDVRPPAAARGGAPTPTPSPEGPVVKSWMLPTGNDFVNDAAKRASRPKGNLGEGVAYIAANFDDSSWRKVNLPHDYAIEGPFSTTGGGGMGRLPSAGVVWYRKNLKIPATSAGKSLFLDIDGAMAYSAVWLNGQFVGGWPYGYASFRLNLTPYADPGRDNVLAIRLDNPPASSRWYPGGGLYRNVWLIETSPVHVAQWGTYITTPETSSTAATINLRVTVDNDARTEARVSIETQIFEIDAADRRIGRAVVRIAPVDLRVAAGANAAAETRGTINRPKLWGVGANQKPNRYLAVTTLRQNGAVVDEYETRFGIRTLKFDPNAGFFLNGEHIKLNGVCNHHDLGALGSAINVRALQRQFELLAEMGCNALRTSHNPPAPELLDLADKMGFLVMDEAFDQWARQKTALDYHLLYPDWHEQDLRAMLRRDRNHPSVILWSIGNEVGEQTGGAAGAALAKELTEICHEEDPTRPTITAMNSASAASPFPAPIDTVGLNYQGAGLFRGSPQYPVFHEKFPDKFIVGSETAATLSSRGVYTFPVATGLGAPASANAGEEAANRQVSSYDLYFAPWAYSPEKEFAAQDRYPFVAGEFVWTGWDYLGEPTPFEASRSSYYGIIDLAGFKKDRFYLYQSYWRPNHPMAHILPHWTWPERGGQVTPVHVYTSGDEAELFLNGRSLGRKKKAQFEYRLRWDDLVYEPGELRVDAYKNGKAWASDSVKTAGEASQLLLTPDRTVIAADGKDLSFVTLTVADSERRMVPRSMNTVRFEITGPAEIVATDNGNPTDMTPFPSKERSAFNGLALAIIRAKRGQAGRIVVTAKSAGLQDGRTTIDAR
jgi:beta-galactosidase